MKKRTVLFILLFIVVLGIVYISKTASEEVLGAFGNMDVKFQESNSEIQQETDSLLEQVSTTNDKEKHVEVKNFVLLSNDFIDYLENLKTDLKSQVPEEDYFKSDYAEITNAYFFTKEGKHSHKANEFITKLEAYLNSANKIIDTYPEIERPIEDFYEKEKEAWFDYNFKDFPLIASITIITSIQNDVAQTNKELLSSALHQ